MVRSIGESVNTKDTTLAPGASAGEVTTEIRLEDFGFPFVYFVSFMVREK